MKLRDSACQQLMLCFPRLRIDLNPFKHNTDWIIFNIYENITWYISSPQWIVLLLKEQNKSVHAHCTCAGPWSLYFTPQVHLKRPITLCDCPLKIDKLWSPAPCVTCLTLSCSPFSFPVYRSPFSYFPIARTRRRKALQNEWRVRRYRPGHRAYGEKAEYDVEQSAGLICNLLLAQLVADSLASR